MDKGWTGNKQDARFKAMRNIDFYQMKFKSPAHVLTEKAIKNYSIRSLIVKNFWFFTWKFLFHFCCVRHAHMLYDCHLKTIKRTKINWKLFQGCSLLNRGFDHFLIWIFSKVNIFKGLICQNNKCVNEHTITAMKRIWFLFEQFEMCLHQHSRIYIGWEEFNCLRQSLCTLDLSNCCKHFYRINQSNFDRNWTIIWYATFPSPSSLLRQQQSKWAWTSIEIFISPQLMATCRSQIIARVSLNSHPFGVFSVDMTFYCPQPRRHQSWTKSSVPRKIVTQSFSFCYFIDIQLYRIQWDERERILSELQQYQSMPFRNLGILRSYKEFISSK